LAAPRLTRARLKGKTIDAHTHAGVSLKAYALQEYPYAQTLEGLHSQQQLHGVDVSVVFPFTADLFFEAAPLLEGTLTPAKSPLSPSPYASENRLLLRELYDYCPELVGRFLPFVSIDPARCIPAQIRALEALFAEYPVYGIKVNPVGCQSPARELLGTGQALLDLAEAHELPLLFHATTLPGEDYSQAVDIFKIVERRPNLRFCLAHCLLFSREWLARAQATPNVWVDTAALKIQVESICGLIGNPYPAAGFVEADYSDHIKVLRTLCEMFPDTLLWGTDSPAYSWICRRKEGEGLYREFRLKGQYADEIQALQALPPALRARVSSENTLDFVFGEH
jgi:predicted TIM-barrel fold metal-dependent hydrolase